MISDLGYRILRALAAYDQKWGTYTIAKEVRATPNDTTRALSNLLDQELVEFRFGYRITEEGLDELSRCPNLTTKAKKWASLVRQAVDSTGHETRVERAAIPSRISPMLSYTPDMEGLIDELREGLSEYD